MKLVRKRDVFHNLDEYIEGKLSIGDCIDECETLDLSDLIISLSRIMDVIDKQEWGYRLEALEGLKIIIEELKEWSWGKEIENEVPEHGRND